MQFILLIFITTICLSMQDVSKKCYSCIEKDEKMGIYTYYLVSVLVTMLVFMINLNSEIYFEPIMLPYAIGFAFSYFAAILFTLKAIEHGSLSLTSLIISYSLLIPSLYGILFLHEELGGIKIIGFVLLLISLFCMEVNKKSVKNDKGFNKKWCVYVIIAFIGNGMCSTLQKIYQMHSGGRGKSEFMLIALCITVIAFLVLRLFHRDTEKDFLPTRKNGGWFGVVSGFCNGIVNWLIMVLADKPASVVYPTISAGSIIMTIIISKIVFKETHSRVQNLSFIIGVLSVVFLNI